MSTFDRKFQASWLFASSVRGMLPRDRDARVVAILVEPKTEPLEGGGSSTSIGFPGLIVPDIVADQEAFARGVVAVLNNSGAGGKRFIRGLGAYANGGVPTLEVSWVREDGGGGSESFVYPRGPEGEARRDRAYEAWSRLRYSTPFMGEFGPDGPAGGDADA